MTNFLQKPSTKNFLLQIAFGFVSVLALCVVVSLMGCGTAPVENGIDESQSALCTQPIWTLAQNFTFEPATTTSNPHLPGSDANGVASANASSRIVKGSGNPAVYFFTRNGAVGNISLGGASCTGIFVQASWPGNGAQKIVPSPYAMSGCQAYLTNATNFDCTMPDGSHRLIPPNGWAIYKTQPGSTTTLYLDYDIYFEGPSFVVFQGLFGHV